MKQNTDLLLDLLLVIKHNAECSFSNMIMKVKSSLKSDRNRDKNCKVVRRGSKIYVLNKVKPRCKARQGS